MSLAQLQQDISNRAFRKIYYLCGEEPYLVNFYLGQLKRALSDAAEDLYVFDGESLNTETFCDTMALYPTFAEKKLVQITDCPVSKSPISAYLVKHKELLSDDTVVVFYETVKVNKTAETAKAFFKFVREQGLYVEIKKLDEKTLLQWTAKQCRLLNLSMSAQTADYFLSSVGNDMFTVRNELQKLAAFCNGRTAEPQDVDRVCTQSIDAQGYLITDAILTKNLDKAYRLLDDYAQMKSSAEMIAGVIFNFTGRLYKIKYLLSVGKAPAQIAEVVGMKEYPVKKYSAAVKTLDIKNIERMLDVCAAADVAIKASNTDNYVILTRLVAQLVELL